MPYTASLSTSITFARSRWLAARQDGCADQIVFWRQRTDELLDEWIARREADTVDASAKTKQQA